MDPSDSKESISDNCDQESTKNEAENCKNEEDERTAIRSELSTMSFEKLMKLKEELGSKVYNEAIFGQQSKTKLKKTKSDFKRENKNRPREESSKYQVPFLGAELRATKTSSINYRDPRFDEKCGEYDTAFFKTNYSFINDIRENEIIELKKKMKKVTGEQNTEIKLEVQRLENQLREDKAWKSRESMKIEANEEIKNAKREGRQPHYATKRELRTKELVKQFEELKNSGRLAKHLEKRRKKNITKDRKRIEIK